MAGRPLTARRTWFQRPATHRHQGAWLGLFASAMLTMALAVHPPHQAAMALEAVALAELSDREDHPSAHRHQTHPDPARGCPHQAEPHPVEARLASAGGHGHDESQGEDMRCPVCVQMAGTSVLLTGSGLSEIIDTPSESVSPVRSSEHNRLHSWLQPPLRAPPLLS